ncbi:MAG: formate dehydrogenase accessory sulfurtransferase FdhD [Candidatus Caldatribacteriota bacterium]|nr:formate dehydrogenase accessory sulfurtransferase FdhD [Candidatus Caldatribacteriota bacterium]
MKERKGIKIRITRISEGRKEKNFDLVAREIPFSIFLNEKKIVTLYCTPENYKYLGLGFLFTSGILQKKEEIKSIKINNEHGLISIEVKGVSFSSEDILKNNLPIGIYQPEAKEEKSLFNDFSFKIKSNQVFKLISKMQEKAIFFKLTGGVHSCALVDKNGSIISFSEDISRYNTIDKILGEAFVKDISIEDKIILTSCRITSGILKKIIAGKLPIVISRAAPTDKAVELARKIGITLVGFVRGERMNIYSCPERIEV